MRFLMYEVDNRASANTPPSPALMAEMGKLIVETTKAGILFATGGLGPNPTRVRSSGGERALTGRPVAEAEEVTGGFAVVGVETHAEAIECASRFLNVRGVGGPVIHELVG